MLRHRWPTLVIAALLVVVQADWWFGKGNWRYVADLNRQLDEQLAVNERSRERNERAAAEISDLKEGAEMVEEKARLDLGMVRGNEVLVQVKPAR
jgi:cell division protein FtsB